MFTMLLLSENSQICLHSGTLNIRPQQLSRPKYLMNTASSVPEMTLNWFNFAPKLSQE